MRVWCEQAWLAGEGVVPHVAIEIHDGKIDEIERGAATTGANLELGGLTLPGFANTHSHAFHRALRGRTHLGRGSFWTWRDTMYSLAGRLDPEAHHRLARAVFAEMLVSGFTAVGEFHYVHHQPDGTPYEDPNEMGRAMIAAADAAGIRLTLFDALYLHGGLSADGYHPLTEHQRRYGDGTAGAYIDRVGMLSDSRMARIGMAVHSVRAVDPDSIALVAEGAGDRPVHAHVSEQLDENEQCLAAHGRSPTQVLDDAGLLSPHFTAIHVTHPSRHDMTLLGSAGSSVCLCPTTERDLADGIGPASELAEAGSSLCIGSDSHAMIDPFEETRGVELNERLATRVRGGLPPEALLEAGTAGGYRALGHDPGGQIVVGAHADLTTVSLQSVRLAGHAQDQLLDSIVFNTTAADVTDVIVAGRHVVREGVHHDIDVVEELSEAIRLLTA